MASFVVGPASPADLGTAADALAPHFTSDPDGLLAARLERDAPALGSAAAVVRGEALVIAHLHVAPAERGQGLGRALYDAARTYGLSRGATRLEVLCPDEPGTLGFFLRRGLDVRTLVLRLERGTGGLTPPSGRHAGEWSVAPVTGGAALAGWVATLDRETRGFARTPEWTYALAAGYAEAWALRKGGRPEGIAALVTGATGEAATHLGPLEARTPAGAAAALRYLAARAAEKGAVRLTACLGAEARAPLQAAFQLGFRLAGSRLLLSTRPRGDFRRYGGSAGGLF